MGVALLLVDSREFRPVPGMIVGAMANLGWSMDDHLGVSDSSREALVELVDANAVMIMLGHNQDQAGGADLQTNYNALVNRWINSFLRTGHSYPTVINVVPWPIGLDGSSEYLQEIEAVMRETTGRVGGRTISFVEYFENLVPDIYNPELYQLDANRVHPLNPETAQHLSEDLEAILFGEGFEGAEVGLMPVDVDRSTGSRSGTVVPSP
jgi:hypothetical protein